MKNKYEIRGDVTAIFLYHKGKTIETLIDTADLPRAEEFKCKWGAEKPGIGIYVCGSLYLGFKKRKHIKLHRWIMNPSDNNVIDHINHDTVDNRRCNLREVLPKENAQNVLRNSNNKSSGIRGVSWHKKAQKWVATVGINGKHTHIGTFDNLDDAKEAAEKARSKYLPFSLDAMNGVEHDDLEIKKRPKSRESGMKGVTWHARLEKWRVRLYFDGQPMELGYFTDLNEAKYVAEKSKNDEDFRKLCYEKFRSKPRDSNKSGVRGVYWDNTHQRWIARISINKKSVRLGYFKDFEQAKDAVLAARRVKARTEGGGSQLPFKRKEA